MGIFDIFSKKKTNESNSLFGQATLGNNVIAANGNRQSQQLLYVTTSGTTEAGRAVDMTMLTKNSTVMSCVGTKARALSQLPINVMCLLDDGTYVDAVKDAAKIGKRDAAKAKQVLSLLRNPNNFQTQYEFWYQWCMWMDLSGEAFTLFWRKNQDDPTQTPIEMYALDSTLITTQVSSTRYPSYRLSTSTYGFAKNADLAHYQVMHTKEAGWQGVGGFNKAILAAELIALDQDIDLYANYVMQNGAKPSGVFMTEQVVPAGKYEELAKRLKEAWAKMSNSKESDLSKPGQGMLLDNGLKYLPVNMLTLQDADAAKLKEQTMRRICGLFGIPPLMIGLPGEKFNNSQTVLDEFYKSIMYPTCVNVQQNLNVQLFQGYPNLKVEFYTADFIKGAPLDQMNYAVAGVGAGILTPNEARQHLGLGNIEGGDEIKDPKPAEPIGGTSPQDTGGGGGSQTKKMNIGK
jgi:HK97 family phage portal protein